jgi:acyl-CoA thioesterase-1
VIPLRRALILATLLAALAIAAPGGAAQEGEPVIVALGDSLTAGSGVAAHEAYPARLEAILRGEGYRYRIANAGVSGDTTAGGLRRVDWVLRAHPQAAIVALGANDGLRGLSVAAMRQNLERIVRRLQEAGARVLLAGMRVPPNYGADYAGEFAAAFPAVARRTGASLMPFLLDGVAARPALNQEDGVHPNAAGHQAMAEKLWPYLKPLLKK